MATYYVSGVWKSSTRITYVFLHSTSGTNFFAGIKTTEASTITLIEAGNIICTLRWSYLDASWKIGAQVLVETHQTLGKILRTKQDTVVSDNLDNMINMAGFIG